MALDLSPELQAELADCVAINLKRADLIAASTRAPVDDAAVLVSRFAKAARSAAAAGQRSAVVYTRPVEAAVWPEVEKLLVADGYKITPHDPGGYQPYEVKAYYILEW